MRRNKSLIRNKLDVKSRISDISRAISGLLRDARLQKQLTQQELAGKLGLRQRQISDLERARIDPRLSTIQNVARALDLELRLIPHHLISTVDALERAGTDTGKRPLYALGDDDTDDTSDESPPPEVGGTSQRRGPTEHQSRPRARSTS